MLSLVNFINNFKKDLISAEYNDECKKFFFKSNLHLMISLEIASSSILDEKTTYLMLKSTIPSSLTSDNKIKKILDDGVKKKYFIKKNYLYKNKEFYYKISKKYSLMITNWYLDNKSKLN